MSSEVFDDEEVAQTNTGTENPILYGKSGDALAALADFEDDSNFVSQAERFRRARSEKVVDSRSRIDKVQDIRMVQSEKTHTSSGIISL